MKAKSVRLVLRNKIDHWIASIEDAELQRLIKRDAIVTGGAIASLLLNEKVADFDVYFKTYETTLAVCRYYVARFSPKSKRGIDCKIQITDGFNRELLEQHGRIDSRSTEGNRIKIMIKSSGVASEDGADAPYEYFESRPDGDAARYVSQVMDDPEEIADTEEEIKESVQEADGLPAYRPVFMSTNAITLSGRIQIVNRFWGKPEEIHANYDFAHCTNYWTSGDNQLVLPQAALEALLTKELRYIGSKYPICSLIRVRKFVRRGFTINAGQILKMIWQVKELDLNDVRVLEDQLTGVDAAYFAQIIYKLREKFPDGKIDNAYLIEIIDRMF